MSTVFVAKFDTEVVIPLAHAGHWAIYALPVLVLTLGLTVLAFLEARARRGNTPPSDRED
jgi:cytochrome c-type biogenesis protein CcmH/NrfF